MKKGYVCRNEDKTVNSCILKGRLYKKNKGTNEVGKGRVKQGKKKMRREKQ